MTTSTRIVLAPCKPLYDAVPACCSDAPSRRHTTAAEALRWATKQAAACRVPYVVYRRLESGRWLKVDTVPVPPVRIPTSALVAAVPAASTPSAPLPATPAASPAAVPVAPDPFSAVRRLLANCKKVDPVRS